MSTARIEKIIKKGFLKCLLDGTLEIKDLSGINVNLEMARQAYLQALTENLQALTENQPSILTSQIKILESAAIPLAEYVTLYELDGKSGYLDWVIMEIVTPNVNSQATFLDIYCDDSQAFHLSPLNLKDRGLGTTTPPLYVLQYVEDGVCTIMLTCKFYFKSKLEIKVRNNLQAQDLVSIFGHVVCEAS